MGAFVAKVFPGASAKTIAKVDELVPVAMFCGIGLLLSLSVLIIDKYTPGDWF